MARRYIRNLKITKHPSLQVAPSRTERPTSCVDQINHNRLKCHMWNTTPLESKSPGSGEKREQYPMTTDYGLCMSLVLGIGSKHFLHVQDRQIISDLKNWNFFLVVILSNFKNSKLEQKTPLFTFKLFYAFRRMYLEFFYQEFCILNGITHI